MKTSIPIAVLSLLLILISCKKEEANSTEFISFDIDGSRVSAGKNITLNNFNSGTLFLFCQPNPENDSVIVAYHTSVSYGDDMMLTFYYFIWEETSRIKLGDYNYRYHYLADLENGLNTCSNSILPYPDTVLHEVLPGIDDTIVSYGSEEYKKSGMFFQLTDFANDMIYISDILSNSDTQQFEITDSWSEEAVAAYGYLVYISGIFDITLRSTSDDQEKALSNGEFQISFYQTDW